MEDNKIQYNNIYGVIVIDNTEIIHLTYTENKIMNILVDNFEKIVSVEDLAKTIYYDNYSYEDYDRNIAVIISRMRKKLEKYFSIICFKCRGYLITKADKIAIDTNDGTFKLID